MTQPRYLPLLKSLLPPESYSPHGDGIAADLEPEARALDDAEDSALRLFDVLEPGKLSGLLPAWEEVYGLPERCDRTLTPSFEARVAAVVAKRLRRGNYNRQFLEAYAEALGYPGTRIRQNKPTTCTAPSDAALFGPMHRFLLDILVPQERPMRMTTCADPCNLPLKQHDDMRIQCAFRAIERGATLFRFYYGE